MVANHRLMRGRVEFSWTTFLENFEEILFLYFVTVKNVGQGYSPFLYTYMPKSVQTGVCQFFILYENVRRISIDAAAL